MSSFQLSQIRKGEGGEESAGNFWYPCDLVPVFSRPGQVWKLTFLHIEGCFLMDSSETLSIVGITQLKFSGDWLLLLLLLSRFSRVRLLATPWTAAYQAPPSMGFSRLLHLYFHWLFDSSLDALH